MDELSKEDQLVGTLTDICNAVDIIAGIDVGLITEQLNAAGVNFVPNSHLLICINAIRLGPSADYLRDMASVAHHIIDNINGVTGQEESK